MMMYQPYNQYYQPINPYINPTVQSTTQTSLTRVTGIDGAKAYQMPANSTVALFDNNDDLMYIKTTDGAGFPTIRCFEFKERVAETAQNVSNTEFVSKAEFEQFKKEVAEYVEQSFWKPNTMSNTNTANTTSQTNGASKQSTSSNVNEYGTR
jgi:hypothetical protein